MEKILTNNPLFWGATFKIALFKAQISACAAKNQFFKSDIKPYSF
jgi:hypothetical protein